MIISRSRENDCVIHMNLLRIARTMLKMFEKTGEEDWVNKAEYYRSEASRVEKRIHSFDYKYEDALYARVMLILNKKL